MDATTQQIVFGGGCFWCTEAIFKMLKGVVSVMPGYTGGTVPNPTSTMVYRGNTGHIEVVSIVYDPALIAFRDLLTVFFATHDPSSVDKQMYDVGPEYRSAVFYSTEEQKAETEAFIAELNARPGGKPIVTQVSPLTVFYPAEDYHQNYYENNVGAQYCQLIIDPKLEKVQRDFAELLKSNEKKLTQK